jgi:hypothetical protein
MTTNWLCIVMMALAAGRVLAAPAPQAPTGLMISLLARPDLASVVVARPRFTWIDHLSAQSPIQSAYQIHVAHSSADFAHPVWDSGMALSSRSVAVQYAGPALTAGSSYCWEVRTWGGKGSASPWSQAQQFHMASGDSGEPAVSDRDRSTVATYPIQQSVQHPVRLTHTGEGHWMADFGRDAFASLKLTLTSAQGGGTVAVNMGEALSASGQVNEHPGGSVRFHRSEIVLLQGQHVYPVPLEQRDARRMPASVGPVMPFRYVELENCPGPVTADSLTRTAAHYLFDESAASFDCSDPALVRVWDLCHYTIEATSFCGIYVDGDRERTPYEADAYIDQLGQYCCDRELTLARHSQEYLIQHPTWPTKWILHSVLIAWNDYLYSGDPDSMAEFYDDLKAKTLVGLERPDGLISTVDPPVAAAVLQAAHTRSMRDIVDWPPSERDGYDMKPVNTVVNAFHYRALVLMGRMAQALGKTADAAEFSAAAARVAHAINTTLVDPHTGLYVDGEGSTHSSLHANMFPLAFGLAPAERLSRVADFVAGKGMACSVYGAQYLLDALYRAGRGSAALALLASRSDRGWLHMLDDVGSTMTLEAWDSRFKPNLDWNHAWGAAPANIIPRGLMGIEPLDPGFGRVRIRPQLGSLTWASLDLPTIRGTIHERVEASAGHFSIQLTLPSNMTARVCIPAGADARQKVLVDGRPTAAITEGQWLVVDSVQGGRRHIELR